MPEPKPLSQSDVLERIEAGYGPQHVAALREQLARCAERPDGRQAPMHSFVCRNNAMQLDRAIYIYKDTRFLWWFWILLEQIHKFSTWFNIT